MAENGNDEDAWLEQLRAALASTTHDEPPPAPERPVEAFDDALDEVHEAAEAEAEVIVEPAATESVERPPSLATISDTPLILETLAALTEAIHRLDSRVEAFEDRAEAEAPVAPAFDQVELDVVVADAIRKATMKAQATGAGTVRLETEVRLLEQTVTKLGKQLSDTNLTALARDRLEKDVHVERLAEAAENVERQLAAAAQARTAFEAGVDKMLHHAKEGDGENVAWTDVMFLTHELRSRIDDLDDQQRRALRDLADWQASIDDRISGMRAQLLDEIRSLRDPRPLD